MVNNNNKTKYLEVPDGEEKGHELPQSHHHGHGQARTFCIWQSLEIWSHLANLRYFAKFENLKTFGNLQRFINIWQLYYNIR